jgi:hypothetical protein
MISKIGIPFHMTGKQKNIVMYNNHWCINNLLASQFVTTFNYHVYIMGKGINVDRMQKYFYM